MPSRRTLPALAIAAFASLTGACSPLALIDPFVPESGYVRDESIAYGTLARQKLDVYRPQGTLRSKTVIVFIYGGSWSSGSRENYRFVGQTLASRGYIVVIPDYRLYPEVRFPAFVDDAADAVAWVHRNIGRYGGDPGRIVLSGHSAGAHIAALLTLDRSYLGRAGVPRGAIAGLVGLAGPYAFDPFEYADIKPIFATLNDRDRARPVTFARAGAPPTLLMHGLEDTTVDKRNSVTLARKLREAGVPVQYVPLPDTGHAGILLALSAPFRGSAPVTERIVEFMDRIDRESAPLHRTVRRVMR